MMPSQGNLLWLSSGNAGSLHCTFTNIQATPTKQTSRPPRVKVH